MKFLGILKGAAALLLSLTLIFSVFVFGVMYQIGAIPHYMW